MSDLELRLRVQAEAAAARREIAAVKDDVAKLGVAAKAASGVSMQDLANQFAGLGGSVGNARESAMALFADLDRLESGFNSLRMAVDLDYAATTRFAEAQTMARLAVSNGIVTQQEAAATLDLLAQKLGLVEAKVATSTPMLQQHAMSQGMAASASQNLAFQLNDVAMMAAAGQNPLMLAMQQGTQISQIFGQAGAAGALGLLKQGFMAFLSPVTLVTVALIAGGTALVQWAFGAGEAADGADTAEEAMGRLLDIIGEFQTDADLAASSLEVLRERYGKWAEEIRGVATAMMDVRAGLAVDVFTEKTIELSEGIGQITEAHRQMSQMIDATISQAGTMGPGVDTEETLQARENVQLLRGNIEELSQSMGLTVDQALRLGESLSNMEGANGIKEIHDRASDTLSVILSLADANGRLPAPLAKAADELATIVKRTAAAATTAEEVGGKFADAADAANWLADMMGSALDVTRLLNASAPGNGWLASAIGQASTLAATLWDAVVAADAARTTNPTVPRLPGGVDALAAGDINFSGGRATRRVPIRTRGGAGGGGGGGSSGPAPGSQADLSDQAQKTLGELDQQIAVINEKVAQGFMASADAAEAISEAKEKAGGDLIDLIVQLDRLGPAGQQAADRLRGSLQGLVSDLKGPIDELSKSLTEGLTAPLKDFIKGTGEAGDVFEKFGDSIIDKMIEIALQQAQMNFLQPLMSSVLGGIGGGSGGGGGLGNAFLAALGAGATAGITGAAMPAVAGVRAPSLPAAKMNAVPSAVIARAPMSMGRQAGQGLGQDSSAASIGGGGPGKVVVNITTPAGHSAKVSDRTDGNTQVIDAVVEAVEGRMAGNLRAGRGAHAAAMQDTFGLTRATR